jgi:hypothetical protein
VLYGCKLDACVFDSQRMFTKTENNCWKLVNLYFLYVSISVTKSFGKLLSDYSTQNIALIRRKVMGIKPGPKRIATTTGKPDRRQRDNKETPGNTPSLKPHKHKKGD